MGEQDHPLIQSSLRALISGLIHDVAGAEAGSDFTDHPTSIYLEGQPIHMLAAARNSLSLLRRALSEVSHHLDRLIARDIEQGGPLRLGDNAYTLKWTTERRLLPEMGERLFDYLADDLRRCVNPANVKITGVRGVAELRGDDPAAVEDTFYQRTILAEPELAVVPVAQRVWAQALADGERLPAEKEA